MKLSYSPSCLGTLCFSTFRQCASTILNCHVCDLAFVGYSNHGASSSLTGSTFTNCTFDIIGGAILPDGSKWTRFGNAVEIWTNTQGNVLIEGCVFSRTFAAAIAILGNAPGYVTQRGLRFVENVMTHCSEGLEIHINTENPSIILFSLCGFYHNILYRSGQNGFNNPTRPRAAIYSGTSPTQMFPIRYNLFYGGDYYNGVSLDPFFSTNDVFLYPGQNILVNDNKKFPISAVAEYRKQYPTDNSNFTEVTPGDSIDITMTKKIESIISWQPPKLKLYQLLNETTAEQ